MLGNHSQDQPTTSHQFPFLSFRSSGQHQFGTVGWLAGCVVGEPGCRCSCYLYLKVGFVNNSASSPHTHTMPLSLHTMSLGFCCTEGSKGSQHSREHLRKERLSTIKEAKTFNVQNNTNGRVKVVNMFSMGI